ncbi:hypothetical protein HPC49_07565 [Pyxidicoccus fallax]|uniref:Uncharacterized protein n=1 Tax=Pyxidicoccus fallax TaxID=394095 RepID=A0A848L736_9BACT|nr:hypothetical protein [Pyxidicoccus fallax]NMO14082.1 hypothetical protein [Pyxidicoccus fallax]NPC78110.1 hypothetical protein [Pyxidicoccus fallax]
MTYDPDFDVDAILRVIGTVNEKYPDGSPEDEALHIAAGALVFLRDRQKLEEYRAYFRKYFTPATSAALVARTFDSRQAADAWLASGEATDGVLVSIAGEGFAVIRLPNRWELLRTPLPEELNQPK